MSDVRRAPVAFARALVARRGQPYLVGLLAVAVTYVASHGRSTPYNNYVLLADALRHGRLWIDFPNDIVSDALLWHDKRWVIEAPAPALLVLPLVLLFGVKANQTLVAIALCGLAMGFATSLLIRMGVGAAARAWLLLFLFAGTDLWWCAELGDVWFIAHVAAVAFVFAALNELAGPARGPLVALFALGAVESRFGLLLTMPFFFAAVGCGGLTFARVFDWRRTRAFVAIFAVAGMLVVAYDFARWGVPYDLGYTEFYHRDSWGQPTGSPFRLAYVPYELYSFFLRAPVLVNARQLAQWPILNVDLSGVALTFTSPALLLAFFARRPRAMVIALWCAVAAAALPNFCYYLDGWTQFGMRHALDFEPFLLVLMARAATPRMPRWATALCLWSALVGLWGIWWWNTFIRAFD